MGRKNRGGYRGGNRGNQANRDQDKAPAYDPSAPLPTLSWEVIPKDSLELSEYDQTKLNEWVEKLSNTVGDEYKEQINIQFKQTVEQRGTLKEKNVNELLEFYDKHPNVTSLNESWEKVRR